MAVTIQGFMPEGKAEGEYVRAEGQKLKAKLDKPPDFSAPIAARFHENARNYWQKDNGTAY